jgi:AmmeMemoRadiSam system protein B
MTDMDLLPPLRQDIDIIPLRHEGQSLLVVKDSLGISDPGLVLRAEVARFFPFFDGATPARDLGAHLSGGEVAAFVEELDRIGLLQTERYRRARDEIVGDFTRRTRREAALADSAYPSDREELAAEIDGLLNPPEETAAGGAQKTTPCAVAAPHIDLRVSGSSYGHAYGSLRGLSPTAIAVLGTGHALEDPYCLTDKSFVTPLGEVPAEKETVRRLKAAGGEAVAREDFAHRGEHSIEFQLLFLQRLFPMEEVPIIPILCGSLEPFLLRGMKPREDPGVARFIDALGHWLSDAPGGRLLVAGVDLSHVGLKFGDEAPAKSLEEQFRASDERLLAALDCGDADAFYETVAQDHNRFKVCGFSALWTLLAALPGVRGKVLDYRVWHEEPTQSAVSFAAVAFHREPSP